MLPDWNDLDDNGKTDFMVALVCRICESKGYSTQDFRIFNSLHDHNKVTQATRDTWDILLKEANARAAAAGHHNLYGWFKNSHPELAL